MKALFSEVKVYQFLNELWGTLEFRKLITPHIKGSGGNTAFFISNK